MNKIYTYCRYLYDYLKNGDLRSVIASVKYVVNESSHPTDRIVQSSIGTFFCRKNTNDFQFANYYYEWGVKKYVLKHQKEFSVFLDIGACIGEYCVLLAKLDKQCYAFEPIKENRNALQTNIKLNNLQDKIKVIPYALGDNDYQSSFTFNPVNTGASQINKNAASTQEVAEIRKLDTIFSKLEIDLAKSIWIKLDIEGMEPDAIRGAKEFIRTYSQLTFILEDKHSGQDSIREAFNEIAVFEFGRVDRHNIFARKIRNF